MEIRHYILTKDTKRWVRVVRVSYDCFMFKGDNVRYNIDDFDHKSKIFG